MDDFNTFPPQPVVVTLACGTLELTPVRLGELPRLLAIVRPLADAVNADPDWLALFGQHGEALLELLTLTTRRERAWINDLPLDDAAWVVAQISQWLTADQGC